MQEGGERQLALRGQSEAQIKQLRTCVGPVRRLRSAPQPPL